MEAKILIVDDHSLIRRGLKTLLDVEPDFRVCGDAANFEQAVQLAKSTCPSIAVVDLVLPDGHGLDLIQKIMDLVPDCRILISSSRDESIYAERCLQAGAHGFIQKQAPIEELMVAIRKVAGGQVYVSEEQQTRMLHRSRHHSVSGGIASLSKREIEVFEYLAQGLATREIAKAMELSPKTIDSFRDRIKQKLGIRKSNELIRYAVSLAAE